MSTLRLCLFLVFLSGGVAAAQEDVELPGAEPLVDDVVVAPPDPLVAPARFWFGGEYLLWWTKNDRTPIPLITTGSATDARPGAIGMPGTEVVFNQLDYRHQSGGRFTLGGWLDDERGLGVEAVGFMLESHTIHGKADSDRNGSPVIARPFVNVATGQQDAQVLTLPGSAFGGIDVFADSRLWGAECNALATVVSTTRWRVDVLGGFRYLGLKDELRFSQSSTLLVPGFMGFNGTPVPPPDIVTIRDMFDTSNQFYGGQLGVRGMHERGRWTISCAEKIGLGATRQEINITGYTADTNSAGASRVTAGGLFSQPSNINSYARSRFTFMSEVDVALAYRLTQRLRISVGYTLLFWDGIVRPGQQLNPLIDPRQVPSSVAFGTPSSPAQPGPIFESTDFWAQGLTCGLELRY